MKSLYITSVEPFIGKTATCLALGRRLQADGFTVGYLKPVSTQPWRLPDGRLADEDAAFVSATLGLEGDPADLTPVMVTPEALRARLKGFGQEDLLDKVRRAARAAGQGKDVLLLEGGASLREGYAIALSNLRLAETAGAPVIVLIRYHREMQLVDDALAAHFRLGGQLLGVLLNQVPEEARPFVDTYAGPFLEREGIRVLGVLPSLPRLSALSVGELVRRLEAQVLTPDYDADALIETFTVGAMTLEACLSRFRRQKNKAVITGGDRTDIQLAALETSTVVLVLTGNLHPSPLVLQQAESLRVPVLLVNQNTMETVRTIEESYGKTRMGEPEKLETFQRLMEQAVDIEAIYRALGLR